MCRSRRAESRVSRFYIRVWSVRGRKKEKERGAYFEVLLVLLRLGRLSVDSFPEIIKANGYDRDEAGEGWEMRKRGQKANAYRFGSGFSFTAFSQTSAGIFGGLPYRCT